MLAYPTTADIKALRKTTYNATVRLVIEAHSDLRLFRIQPDTPVSPHQPGQYTTLGLGFWEPRLEGCEPETLKPGEDSRMARRAYSISHPILGPDGRLAAHDPGRFLEFYVVLVRQLEKPGAPSLTPRLFMLQEGDRLSMGEKITGHFTLDPIGNDLDKDVIMLSTGTGEAPFNYMTWELLRRGQRGLVVTSCCVRYRRDLAYLATHEKLMQKFPNYVHIPLATRDLAPGEEKRYIQDLITTGELEARMGKRLDPARMHVFLCGNPAMIGIPRVNRATGQREYPQPTGVVEILEQRGFQSDDHHAIGNLHFEKYW